MKFRKYLSLDILAKFFYGMGEFLVLWAVGPLLVTCCRRAFLLAVANCSLFPFVKYFATSIFRNCTRSGNLKSIRFPVARMDSGRGCPYGFPLRRVMYGFGACSHHGSASSHRSDDVVRQALPAFSGDCMFGVPCDGETMDDFAAHNSTCPDGRRSCNHRDWKEIGWPKSATQESVPALVR